MDIEISLSKSEFEKTKGKLLAAWKKENPDEEEEYESYQIKSSEGFDEQSVDNNIISVSAPINHGEEYLGYITIDIPLTNEVITEIISQQIKQFNKIKTLLEVVK